jgi:hypothetical protein
MIAPMTTPNVARGQLLAVSDLRVTHPDNRRILELRSKMKRLADPVRRCERDDRRGRVDARSAHSTKPRCLETGQS